MLNPSILKTECPPVTCARSNDYRGRSNAPDRAAQRPPAGAGSFCDPKGQIGHCASGKAEPTIVYVSGVVSRLHREGSAS